MQSGLKVADAMTIHAVAAGPGMPIREVAALMDRHDVGSVLIKNGKELLGIVTESDFVRRAVLLGYDTSRIPVRMIMTKDIITVSPGMDIFDALILMKDTNVRHLPVVDEGKNIGLVTSKDILKLQPDLFETFADSIELREEKRKMWRRREDNRVAVIDIEDFERWYL